MINYQKELEKIIEENEKNSLTPSVLLHSCCAPCSSACLERLAEHFSVTVFYYNPNIYPESEYLHRVNEQKRLISEMEFKNEVGFIEGKNNPKEASDVLSATDCGFLKRRRLQRKTALIISQPPLR